MNRHQRRAAEARAKRDPQRKRGAPKKQFDTDPDRDTIDVAEVLHVIGFNRTEAFDLAASVREGQLVAQKGGELGFRLPGTVDGRIESLRQKSERESTPTDSLRRSLLGARLIIANRARTRDDAIRALDSLLTIAAVGGVEKLRQTVRAMCDQSGKRRKRRVAKRTH
jgi:hypothetical protein